MHMHCYVAVCNNYAICNTLQTAFKLRCEGNAICNVLQIASKFYHLKILKRREILINCKMHRFNNACKTPNQHLYLVRTLFCPRTFPKFEGGGALKPIRPSVYWFVCPSLCHKNFNLAHIFWSVKDIHVTLFLTWVILWKSPSTTFHQFHDLYTELVLHRIMNGFHGAFATGVASQQGTLTLPDTWFRPQFWDLLMLQLLRPNSSNLPCLYSTFHLEYPLVLSRYCFQLAPCRDLSFDLDLLQGQFILPTRGGQQLSEFACRVYFYTVVSTWRHQ